jgi:hypothetical protein
MGGSLFGLFQTLFANRPGFYGTALKMAWQHVTARDA